MKVLLVDSPRYEGIPVIREERCEIRLRSSAERGRLIRPFKNTSQTRLVYVKLYPNSGLIVLFSSTWFRFGRKSHSTTLMNPQ